MGFLSRLIDKKPKGKYVLSLDVGTRLAKAMVSYVDFEESSVTTLGIGRAPQKTGNVVGGKIVEIQGVIAACRAAISEATQMAGAHPEEVTMGFSGNTVKMCTNTFEISRQEAGEKIDGAELKSIIHGIHEKSLQRIREGLTYKEKQIGTRLVSADIVSFSIDGYRVINPLNFRGKRMKITVSDTYVLRSDFDIITTIARELGLRLSKVAYGPYAVVKAVGAADAQNFNALLIDVGGNITDVILVKNGNIQKAGMFILGGHLFTRRLANKYGIAEAKAEELKLNYAKGRLNETDQKRIDSILTEDVALWFSGVQLILEEASREFLIPSRILFYGGSCQLPGIAGSVNRLEETNLPFSDKLQLDFIRSGYISRSTDKTKKLNEVQDITLVGLAHLYLDSIDTEDSANLFLAQIIKQ
jgi:cell division protein FtsA